MANVHFRVRRFCHGKDEDAVGSVCHRVDFEPNRRGELALQPHVFRGQPGAFVHPTAVFGFRAHLGGNLGMVPLPSVSRCKEATISCPVNLTWCSLPPTITGATL